MRKTLLILFLISSAFMYAQEPYNKWSIEAAVGMPVVGNPWTDGYHYKNNTLASYNLGVRHMFNNRFGIKVDFGLNTFENTSYGPEFESYFYHGNVQGVVNLLPIMGIGKKKPVFGLLAHVGTGYSLHGQAEHAKKFEHLDQSWNVIAGITPQLRLGNRVALTTDISVMGIARMHRNWDAMGKTERRGLNGSIVTATAGLTVYLGKHERHADWVHEDEFEEGRLSDLEARVAKIETDMLDSDGDGVPDYLDEEPNTPAGAIVDTKGRAIDKNNNNIPDFMEAALDARYALKGTESDQQIVKHLIDLGLINVYFPFNSSKPHSYSSHALNYVSQYLKANPNARVELIGYADEIGRTSYNQTLSERRAKTVYNILLATGVSGDRMTYKGEGEDSSVDKNSAEARQLVRRVIFRIQD